MTCPPTGSQTKILLEPGASAHTFDASSIFPRLEWETLQKVPSWIAAPGLTGNLQIRDDDRRPGPTFVRGDLGFRLRPGELTDMLDLFVGTESPAGTFKTASGDPPYFGLLAEKITDTFEYQDLRATRVVIRTRATALQGGDPQPAEMIISVIGKSRVTGTTWPVGAPALSTGEEFKPFIFEDSALTIDSVAHRKMDVLVVINYYMAPEWYGDLTPSDICPQRKKTVQLRARFPYGTAEDALLSLSDDPTGVDGNLLFSFATTDPGTVSLDVQFGKLKSLPEDPSIRGQGKIHLVSDFVAGATGAADDVTMVLDANTAT